MTRILRAGAAAAALLAAPLVLAQGKPFGPAYNTKSEVTVRGRVADVQTIPDWMGSQSVNVTLQSTTGELVHVDAAPADFLKMVDFKLAAGDDLDVTGAYARVDGTVVLLARHLKKNHVTISVRDPGGAPVW